jgi:hypothetical protein
MIYSPKKLNKRVLEEHQLKKHVKILRELPQDANGRVANAHHRHEILKANKMYQLRIERDRANAAIASLPVNAQVNLRQMLVSQRNDIREAMLRFARKGGVP